MNIKDIFNKLRNYRDDKEDININELKEIIKMLEIIKHNF